MPPHRFYVKDHAGTSHAVDGDANADTLAWLRARVREFNKALPHESFRLFVGGRELKPPSPPQTDGAGDACTIAQALSSQTHQAAADDEEHDWSKPTTIHVVDFFLSAELRGRRPGYMEDRHTLYTPAEGEEPFVFGVFDGHGGEECAEFLRLNLAPALAKNPILDLDPPRAIRETFATIDEQYRKLTTELNDAAAKRGEDDAKVEDGSTATVVVLLPRPDNRLEYHVAVTGDSRAVLVKRDGTSRPTVLDHHPSRLDERVRIEREGGRVEAAESGSAPGMYRVVGSNGSGLAVTRAFGDFAFKPFVTCEPEIVSGVVGDDDAFLYLASDGVWGDVTNDEVARVLALARPVLPCCFNTPWLFKRSHRNNGDAHSENGDFDDEDDGDDATDPGDSARVCACVCERCWQVSPDRGPAPPHARSWLSLRDRVDQLMDLAFDRGSDDNITSVVVDLAEAQKRLTASTVKSPVLLNAMGRGPSPTEERRRASTNASDASGPNSASGTKHNHNRRSVDAILAAAARRISSAAAPLPPHIRHVQLPGLSTRFSNDLVLWRYPHISFLWFVGLNVFFFCVVKLGYPAVSLIALLTLVRLLFSFATALTVRLLQRVGFVSWSADVAGFHERNYMVSSNTIDNLCQAGVGLLVTFVSQWREILINGSNTKLLITLRTLTYLYTPVDLALLAWIVAFLVFTLPATYARNQADIDEGLKRASVWAHKTSADVEKRVKAHPTVVKMSERWSVVRRALRASSSSTTTATTKRGESGSVSVVQPESLSSSS